VRCAFSAISPALLFSADVERSLHAKKWRNADSARALSDCDDQKGIAG
jgi:hypothetical protein